MFKNKTILITGGTGSFGQAFTKKILKEDNPKAIRIFSRGEKEQVLMERKFNDRRLRFFIGDVRDSDRLYRALKDVDIVVHAAALKHVTVGEYNPIETIKTNVNGAINVIENSIKRNVERVMAISTDKAVHPVNLYGATKMTAEKLFIQANVHSYKSTKFSCVRYGNVIGSSGSVIPLFKKQKLEGELKITHPEMTRFWIKMDDAINFVRNCIDIMHGWEIFVPKMKSMRIIDVANTVAPNGRIKIIGVRPGEKIHEVLITEDEARHTITYKDFYIVEPEYEFVSYRRRKDAEPLVYDQPYTSDNNSDWWKIPEIAELI